MLRLTACFLITGLLFIVMCSGRIVCAVVCDGSAAHEYAGTRAQSQSNDQ